MCFGFSAKVIKISFVHVYNAKIWKLLCKRVKIFRIRIFCVWVGGV